MDGREELLGNLQLYPEDILAELTDEVFAKAVWDAVDMLCDLFNDLDVALWAIVQRDKELEDCRKALSRIAEKN